MKKHYNKYIFLTCLLLTIIFIISRAETFENPRCIDTKLKECALNTSDKKKLEDAFDFVKRSDYGAINDCLDSKKVIIPGEGCFTKNELNLKLEQQFKKKHSFLGMFL